LVQPETDSTLTSTLRRALRLRWVWFALALLVAIRASLPIVLESTIPWLAERKIGVAVAIDNIDLGVFSGEFIVEGLSVANPAGSETAEAANPSHLSQPTPVSSGVSEPIRGDQTPEESNPDLLSLVRLQVEIEWLALLGSHLSLPVVRFDGLTLHVHQNRDGSFALPTLPQSEGAEDLGEAAPTGPSEDIEPRSPSPSVDDSSSASEPQEVAEETGGWQFSLGRFELNEPDLVVYSERAGKEVVRLRLARFAVDALTSGAAGFGFGDIALDSPELFVERDWLFDPGLGGGDAVTGGDSRSASIQVARLAMNSGKFRVRSPDGPIDTAIRVEVLEFDTAPGHTFPIEVSFDLGEGSAILNGRLGITPPSFEGKLTWRNLRVPPYLLLTTPAIVPWLASCDASGQLVVSFRSQEPAQLTLRGESEFADLVFRHPETGELALEAQRMSMQVREAIYPLDPTQPRRVEIKSFEISAPKAVFTNPPDALYDLLAIYTEPPPLEETAADEPAPNEVAATPQNSSEVIALDAEPAAAMIIAIDELKVANGELVFVDRTVKPRHETRIRDFRLDAKGVTSAPGGAEQFELAGLIQQQGTFKVEGKLPGGKGSLRINVRRLDLVGYNGFARKAGMNLHAGDASFESVIQALDGRYKAKNDIVLHDLRVDTTEPGAFSSAFGVSLDFALALLRGPGGDIKLALPVSFDKSGAGVGMASLLGSALKDAFTGALTSPIKLLGRLLPTGAESDSLEGIAFEPGESELGTTAERRIAPFITLLNERPALGLTLHGQTAEVDEPGLAYAILRDRAVSGDGLPELEGAGFFARRRLASALRERAEGGAGVLDSADEALLSRYVETQTVSAERYEALAQTRAQSVLDALITAGAPATALTIGAPKRTEAPGVVFSFGLRARGGDSPLE
jgi:hypothetical protein